MEEPAKQSIGAEKLAQGRVAFLWWLFCACFSLAGVQFCYSIQFALGTPLFHDQLRVDPSTISIIMSTAGPISGLIIQPVVGAWSDSLSTRWGRRRPFVAIGALFCAGGMALIAASVDLGKLFGDKTDGRSASDHSAAIAFAIVGLWVMNMFVNTIQGPARAIVADLVPAEEQQAGNAMASGVMGMAAIIANVVGAQLFLTSAPYRNLFAIGVVCIVLSAIPTLIVAKEGPRPRLPGEKSEGPLVIFAKILHAFRNIPRRMIIVVVVFFLSWCAYSPYMVYITDYFGVNVFKGSTDDGPYKDAYKEGVKMGMYGSAVFSAVQWLFSFALSPLVNNVGAGWTYAATQLLATISYILLFVLGKGFLNGKTAVISVAFVLMGATATNFTTMCSVPYGLVRNLTGGKDAGLFMGVLNAASVVAQTITNLIVGQIVGAAPHDAPHDAQNVSYGFLVGAVLSFIAIIAAVFLPKVTEGVEPEKQPLVVNTEEAPAPTSASGKYGSV